MQKETEKNIDSTSIILNEQLDKALGERYLTYALSTITDRALPDSRDGLKPVHRRILYAMSQLKLNPNGSFRKCATPGLAPLRTLGLGDLLSGRPCRAQPHQSSRCGAPAAGIPRGLCVCVWFCFACDAGYGTCVVE